MNLKEKAKQLQLDIPALFIALRKKETPLMAKVLAMITVCYALSPIDLIPDFIPILGYLDDILILPFLIALTVRLIPQDIMTISQQESKDLWNNGKPKKWYFAIPIVSLWVLIVFVTYKFIRGRFM